jgi:glyoxylase-like metal-dependent hydrolase (beta-lactamase superfamily II)
MLMRRLLFGIMLLGLVVVPPRSSWAANYDIQKVATGVYAAVAQPKGKAASNAMIVVTNYEVILAGAHFVPEAIKELLTEIGRLTPLPLRRVILTHHHRGFNYVDFDLPANVEIITSWQAYQALKSELRELRNPLVFFDKRLTMQRDGQTIVLNNVGQAHSEGDLFVYLPKEGILFTSDLLFNDAAGYMGDGTMRDWILCLEMMAGVGARTVIPGIGKVTDSEGIDKFLAFFRDYLTEVLRNVEKGNNLVQTKKEFSLPQYRNLPGFKTFFEVNLERAYKELKNSSAASPRP